MTGAGCRVDPRRGVCHRSANVDNPVADDGAYRIHLTLQLPFMQVSESMGNHDSKIVDAASVD